MTVLGKNSRRDVIPRWRLSGASRKSLARLPAGSPPPAITVGPQEAASELLSKFDIDGKPLIAAEALSSAISHGDRETAIAASERLQKFDLGSRPALKSLVDRVLSAKGRDLVENPPLSMPSLEQTKLDIKHYKKIVRAYPGSPLAWLDLAFSYAAIGQSEKAKDAVVAACALERNHRGVVRASSRFFIHYGDFDRAIEIISRSDLLKVDPWLISAHIATSKASGRSSPLIGVGRKMFKDDKYRSDQLSELGVALATNEIEHGNSKLAAKVVNRALTCPTENAVAQVAWLESIGQGNFNVSGLVSRVPDAWEARTVEEFENENWLESCAQAEFWLLDQPFSSRPAVHGSYVAATFLQDYVLSLRFAEAGFRANPSDSIVANNYAVSLAEVGRVAEGRKVFDENLKDIEPRWRPVAKATDGLISYREGRFEQARLSYAEAAKWFLDHRDFRSTLLATIYQAREELRIGQREVAAQLMRDALQLSEDKTGLDLAPLIRVAEGLHQEVKGA